MPCPPCSSNNRSGRCIQGPLTFPVVDDAIPMAYLPFFKTGPYHQKLISLCAIQKTAIGYISGGTDFLNIACRPWRGGSIEQGKISSHRMRQVLLQLHQFHCAISYLHPFMAIYHIRNSVFFPQGTIKHHPVHRSVRFLIVKWQKRSIRAF